LQLSSVLVLFAPNDDDDVLSFLLSVNSFLENPMHLPWVCCCSTGILKDPHFYQPHLTVDAPLDHTPHATDTSITTRLKKQASSQLKMEASASEDGSEHHHNGRWKQQQLKMGSIITMEDGSISN